MAFTIKIFSISFIETFDGAISQTIFRVIFWAANVICHKRFFNVQCLLAFYTGAIQLNFFVCKVRWWSCPGSFYGDTTNLIFPTWNCIFVLWTWHKITTVTDYDFRAYNCFYLDQGIPNLRLSHSLYSNRLWNISIGRWYIQPFLFWFYFSSSIFSIFQNSVDKESPSI